MPQQHNGVSLLEPPFQLNQYTVNQKSGNQQKLQEKQKIMEFYSSIKHDEMND